MKLLRVDLVNNAQFNMRSIQTKPLVAQSRKNKYEDHNIRDMAFYTSGNVLLKVSHMKGAMRILKKGKLSPRSVVPLKVLECV